MSMPESTPVPLISLENVHVAYAESAEEALRGVTLDIRTGEHVCVLGGNGSGKSTLLQLVNALVLPTAGTVRTFGIPTTDAGRVREIRQRAACVFQHPEDQMVTSIVADDVAFGPENLCVPQAEIAQRVDEALATVNMGAHAQADPADLSGGQQQRVAVAGALAMQPEILLLDEPSAMLDERGHRAIQKNVAELNAQGITIVHVTHFMEDALAASRVIVLHQGRIALDGTPQEVFADPVRLRELGLEPPVLHARSVEQRPLASGSTAEPQGRAQGGLQDAAIVFEDVSFSYVAAANPRRRGQGFFGSKHARRLDAAARAPLAVRHLSFTAKAGTCTALIGETGSGKSTTAELACALKLPLSGTVRVGGICTTDQARRRELRRHVGYVSQLPERQLFAETVFDDVAFGPRNLGLAPEEVERRVREALESVNLNPTDELLARSPFARSGGQQRSVALAGVLAMRQPVLVLDEPMAGLDPAGCAHVRKILHRLKRANTALIMVTHSLGDVAELADQVILLGHGTMRAQGTPAEVLPMVKAAFDEAPLSACARAETAAAVAAPAAASATAATVRGVEPYGAAR